MWRNFGLGAHALVFPSRSTVLRVFTGLVLLALIIAGYLFFKIYTSKAFDGGTGTPDDPYLIGDCAQLQEMDDQPEYMMASFELTADIDCSSIVPFETIGNYQNYDGNFLPFTGRFDGQGYTISNVTVGTTTDSTVGLFSTLFGASVRNLNLDNFTVSGAGSLGALAGRSDSSGVIGVSVTNSTITSYSNTGGAVGGVIGSALTSNFFALSASSTVVSSTGTNHTGSVYSFGGLVGRIYGFSTLDNSFSNATVTADVAGVGGLVGAMGYGSVVKNSYSESVITGYEYTGGIVGAYEAIGNTPNYILSVYSDASVTATRYTSGYTGGILGGVSGCCGASMYISNSFAVGPVASTTLSGGISGVPAIMSNNVYYPTGTGQTRCIWSGGAAGCTTNNTSSYYNSSLNAPLSSWDFANVWAEVPSDRPELQIFPYTEPGSPTAIGSCAALASAVRANPVGWFQLSGNIDCSNDSSLVPLTGNTATTSGFFGTLDGQNFSIAGIGTSKTATAQYQAGLGLFQQLFGATIQDVTLSGSGVRAQYDQVDRVGGLAGTGMAVFVENVTSSVPVTTGEQFGGGLIGFGSGVFNNVTVNADVDNYSTDSYGYWTGGLIGDAYVVQMDNVEYNGNITTYWYSGGLVGIAEVARITNATTTGNFVGNVVAGGMLGGVAYTNGIMTIKSTVDNAHSSMDFTTNAAIDNYMERVGGIVGYSQAGVDISNSSYTGTIALTDPVWGQTYNVGGLAGELSSDFDSATSTITNSFTDAYITAVGNNGNAPYLENIGGFIGEAGYVDVSDSVSSTSMLFGGVNPADHIGGIDYVGGFVGYNWSGLLDVDNVQVNGSMTIYDDATGNNGGWGWGLGGFGGYVGSAIIQNSTSSVDIFYQSYEPGAVSNFAGDLEYTTIRNVVVDGDLVIDGYENPYQIGGLAGYATDIIVATTTVRGDITLTNTLWPYDIGGLIGYLDGNSRIQQTYTDNSITVQSGTDGTSSGPFAVAGFIGEMNYDNTFINTYASTTISVTSSVLGNTAGGNIAGYVGYVGWTGNSITDSYSTGSLTLTADITSPFTRIGGFIGWSDNGTNTYTDNFTVTSIASMASSSMVGGFVGRYNGGETFTSNYYDQTATQQLLCSGIDALDPAWCTAENIGGADPTYFFTASNQPMGGWDFTTTWLEYPNTYPRFGIGSGGGGPTPPTVTSDSTATSITQTGATVEGEITDLGSGTVTARGFVYGTTPLFGATTTENSAGFATGIFSDPLTGLVCNTTYYFAAYAFGVDGSDYGSTESFVTDACGSPAIPPTVTTSGGVSSLTQTSVTLSGNISALGSATITTRGFTYGTTPSLGATTTENSAGFSTGAFTSNLSSLACGTTYYFRAYASGVDGVGMGSVQSFITNACTTPTNSGGNSGGGTKVKDKDKGKTEVLTKTDNITICHSAGGKKYVTLTNVQVFITLANSVAVAELRGHDGHNEDIVPAFNYDFGDGIRQYSGNNWNQYGQKLYANNCELFLEPEPVAPPTPTPPAPIVPAPSPVPKPVPETPIETPAPVCELVSLYTKTTTEVSKNTTVSAVVPQGAVRSKNVEEKEGKKDYELTIKVKPIENKRADELKAKFTDILDRFQDKKGQDEAPYGILKKLQDTEVTKTNTKISKEASENNSTVLTTNRIPVVTTAPCATEEETSPVTPAPVAPPVPVVLPEIIVPPEVPAVIVSDILTPEIIEQWVPENVELLLPPIQVVVEDPEGEYLENFEAPVLVEVQSPDVVGLGEGSLIILQPSEDGTKWYEVPYEIEDDTLKISVSRPGEIFVWLVPKAEAAKESPVAGAVSPLFEFEIPLIVLKAISYFGLGAGLVYIMTQLSRSPVTTANLPRVILHGWHNFIGMLATRKRRRPWGTVYDSVTKAPVDPAYVELFDTNGKKQAEAITDLDGRYGFVVPEGMYSMSVRKSNYSFPSKQPSLTGQDVIYSHLYFGGPLAVSSAVVHDVPMDPVNFDWNQYEKLRTKQTRYFHLLDPLIVRFFDLIFFVGAGLMAWQFLNEMTLVTSVLFSCYLILLIARFFGARPVLYGSITENGLPLQFALVRIMQNDTTIVTKVTDAEGRYVAIVPPETYTVRIEKRISENSYEPVFERKIRAKHGVINVRLKV